MIDRSTRPHVVLVLLLLMTATAGTWCKKVPKSIYSEDLAVHSKKFKPATQAVQKPAHKRRKQKYVATPPLHAVTEQLDYLLERKKAASKQVKHVRGYAIQVYAGGSREAAFKARNKLYLHCPTITPEVTYDLPNYTVRFGKFLDKLEAYAVYAAIKKQMPQAIIRPLLLANTRDVFTNKPATDGQQQGAQE